MEESGRQVDCFAYGKSLCTLDKLNLTVWPPLGLLWFARIGKLQELDVMICPFLQEFNHMNKNYKLFSCSTGKTQNISEG